MPLHVSNTMCSSSGGQNCVIQHLVSSHSVGGCPVYIVEILVVAQQNSVVPVEKLLSFSDCNM